MPTAAVVSYRLGHADGVSVEAAKWIGALRRLGYDVFTVAGDGIADVIYPGLAYDASDDVAPPSTDDLRATFAPADVVIAENICSLPLNPRAGHAVADALRGRRAVLRHHDVPWQRERFAHWREPLPTDAQWSHVCINQLTQRELRARGIDAHVVYNHFDLTPTGSALAARDALGEEARAVLLLAALCHDLGKPATTSHDPDGRIRSPGHDQAGIAPTEALLRRIGCPQNIAAQVVPLVREHMVHIGMAVTERAVRRLALRLAPATIEAWGRLVEADHGGRPPLPPGNPGAEIVALAQRLGAAEGRPEPILHGRDLIAAGLAQPGPQLGALLKQAYAAQIDGAFATLEAGLAWAEHLIHHEELEES